MTKYCVTVANSYESSGRSLGDGIFFLFFVKDRTLRTASGMKSARIRNDRQKKISRGCAAGYPFSYQKSGDGIFFSLRTAL